ncbi:MAG: fatty acid desaturase [Spirochaetia bacterium]|nr:fatty acid desaturase [Spirochaetia bacterium]
MQGSLAAVRAEIPAHCLKPNLSRAVFYIATYLAFFAGSVALAAFVWAQKLYWLYPVSWFIGGTACTSLFVLAHDCGHYSILKSKRAMNVLGHLFLLPVFYPFYAWKHSHDAHHKYTNLLKRSNDVYFDNAWIPETVSEYMQEKQSRPMFAWLYRLARAVPMLGSWMHHGFYLLGNPGIYREDHAKKVRFSLAFLLVAFILIAPVIVYVSGSILGLLHFWILPGLAFQFWMSIYTFLHHTSEDIPFLPEGEWTPFRGQVECTVNCLWPRAVSFLHGNIDIHLPHHVAANIPAYWLRDANSALKNSKFSNLVKEIRFTPAYFLRQVKACKVWDEKAGAYAGFPG